ncbi:accessory Sec system protein Asp2 [Lacticaseibacillus chiayiensis]|uniref:accessory Sec system protein Asp2 n=1 Tax=Lacticaseibacillus chiayiensis TaxID=2100821 RepID=UPI0010100FB9|nr:hypothetical protein CHT97_03845 [Lacticaseibacillus chiayiensis]
MVKAKKRNTKKVIQVGENALPLETLLVDEFEYIWINDADTPPVKEHALFKLNRLNSYYQDALFLIDQTSPWCNRPEILTALPANQILYDQAVEMAPDCQKIMQLKGAHQLDFSDVDALATTINKYFFGNQAGYRMPPSWFTIAPGFEGVFVSKANLITNSRLILIISGTWQLIQTLPNGCRHTC